MTFAGRVSQRSSAAGGGKGGPPGETPILALNPGRREAILRVTGWEILEPGSLNLEVADSVVTQLGEFEPTYVEPAAGVKYPAPYQSIPALRKAYWYYLAIARVGDTEEAVLVRRAENPLPGRVELFAAVSLTEKFNLKPNDAVTVQVRSSRMEAR